MSEMKMTIAKASAHEIEKMILFFQFIEEFMEYGTHTPHNEEFEEESIDLSDEQFVEMLRKHWGGRFKPPGIDATWSRIVFGYDTLVSNVCDPDVDYLALRPELASIIEE